MKNKQYHAAKTLYERAKRTLNTPDVQARNAQKIAMAGYMENYDLAVGAKANLDKEGCRAYAQIARKYVKEAARNKDEADKLNGDLDALIKWAEGG